ncbi:MAG: GNAT family N-acetyltransferase [Clostridiaceae bacterium]|nr:GNAT family N-acetyltransferase [Clostridiaceae bacterium]
MSVYRVINKKCIEHLFCGWNETLIWSCLEDIMGQAYAENIDEPKSAQILIGDFCFFSGKPNKELIKNKPKDCKSDFIIMIPQNEEWARLIEDAYKENATKVKRYAIKKEPDVFDLDKLNNIVSRIDESFELRMVNEELYNQVISNEWSKDLCSQFVDYKDYKERGIGVVAVKDGVIVSGASSYTVYSKGIEIEIDTRKDYRRRKLALACGAKLILECLKKGLYPSWDAQNKESVALAEALGYHFDKEYIAYEVLGF